MENLNRDLIIEICKNLIFWDVRNLCFVSKNYSKSLTPYLLTRKEEIAKKIFFYGGWSPNYCYYTPENHLSPALIERVEYNERNIWKHPICVDGNKLYLEETIFLTSVGIPSTNGFTDVTNYRLRIYDISKRTEEVKNHGGDFKERYTTTWKGSLYMILQRTHDAIMVSKYDIESGSRVKFSFTVKDEDRYLLENEIRKLGTISSSILIGHNLYAFFWETYRGEIYRFYNHVFDLENNTASIFPHPDKDCQVTGIVNKGNHMYTINGELYDERKGIKIGLLDLENINAGWSIIYELAGYCAVSNATLISGSIHFLVSAKFKDDYFCASYNIEKNQLVVSKDLVGHYHYSTVYDPLPNPYLEK